MDKSVMPKVFNSHQNWYSSTVDSLNLKNLHSFGGHRSSPELLYTYDHAAHGFSAVLSLAELEALKKAPGFISAYPDSSAQLYTTHKPEFISLDTASALLHASNYGKDTIIGIVDSGVWPQSPSFNDEGITTKVPSKWKGSCDRGQGFNSSMWNAKLIGVRYFNKGAKENIPLYIQDSALDRRGHGTAVFSIAAGNYVKGVSFADYAEGTAKGVAPHARVAVYKVMWNGRAFASDIISCWEKRYEN